MIAIPAVDLREGACVQLVGGSYADEKVRLDDPARVARDWVDAGFRRLHVVDLDAATGRGGNDEIVREILRTAEVDVQVGGGVRDAARIDTLLSAGAAWVVVGTRALEEPRWLEDVASEFPHRLVVAADVRERKVVTRGWARTLQRGILDVLEDLNELPLAGVLVTAVHREGKLQGTDLFLMDDVAEASAHPVLASGGVSSVHELESLADAGIAGAVLGMALYTGTLHPRVVAEEFSE